MLTTSAAKFCVKPRSPFPNISHHDPKTLGKPVITISWPEYGPEFPDDPDGGCSAAPTILPSDQTPFRVPYQCAGMDVSLRIPDQCSAKPEKESKS